MSGSGRFQIGYALAEKKRQSFLQPSLVEQTRLRGIDLVAVDTDKPLVEQGPFDAILHKMSAEDWNKQLEEYSKMHPTVPIIDPPAAIANLHSRISMLDCVTQLSISAPYSDYRCEKPLQILVETQDQLAQPDALNLKFPMIAKPLVANGSVGSHSMSLVFNTKGIQALNPPLILQEFVNHGGMIFKVYVVDEFVKCVLRKSLPDVSDQSMSSSVDGILPFSQISNLPSVSPPPDTATGVEMDQLELPPESFINDVASGLRKALGLRLFNFDIIRDSNVPNRYLVVDINYFPGYAKMPGFEAALTDFFWSIFHKSAPPPHDEALLQDPKADA